MSTDILASLLEATKLALSQGDSHTARQYIATAPAVVPVAVSERLPGRWLDD